jgi:hypothetical protein
MVGWIGHVTHVEETQKVLRKQSPGRQGRKGQDMNWVQLDENYLLLNLSVLLRASSLS